MALFDTHINKNTHTSNHITGATECCLVIHMLFRCLHGLRSVHTIPIPINSPLHANPTDTEGESQRVQPAVKGTGAVTSVGVGAVTGTGAVASGFLASGFLGPGASSDARFHGDEEPDSDDDIEGTCMYLCAYVLIYYV